MGIKAKLICWTIGHELKSQPLSGRKCRRCGSTWTWDRVGRMWHYHAG